MGKIYKLSNESILRLRTAMKNADFEDNFRPVYLSGADNGYSENDLHLVDGFYEVPDFELKADKKGRFDFVNSKAVYESLNFLSPEQADDPRLWVYLSNCRFYEYTKTRWLSSTSSREVFMSRLLYEGTGRGVRTRNSISRLWWTAHLTYDESNKGKEWDLTKAIFDNQDLQVGLLERNLGSYPILLKTFLNFYINNQSEMSGVVIQEMIKELNNIGGVYSLPFLDENDLNKILNTLYTKYKRS
jgi:hypothetical protein